MSVVLNRTQRQSSTVDGMVLITIAMLMLPGIDAFAKLLTATMPAGQIATGRFVFQTLFLLPVMLYLCGARALRPTRVWPHALRGALIAAATLLFFSALKVMPMANAIAIFFVEPLILTLISGLFLGERVGWRRLAAVLVGFGGALLIIRPSFAQVGWSAVLPLGTAVCFAVYLALTRVLARGEDPVAMQCYTGFFGALVMGVALIAGTAGDVPVLTPAWAGLREWLLLAGLGVVATIGHVLVVYAFRYAEAAVLAPFQYLEIISATILGFLLFGDFPDPLTWLGIVVIVGSGLFVFWREQRVSRREAQPAAAP